MSKIAKDFSATVEVLPNKLKPECGDLCTLETNRRDLVFWEEKTWKTKLRKTPHDTIRTYQTWKFSPKMKPQRFFGFQKSHFGESVRGEESPVVAQRVARFTYARTSQTTSIGRKRRATMIRACVRCGRHAFRLGGKLDVGVRA